MSGRHVAVIGGGLTGLACAQALRAQGDRVTVFDKGRRPGGRLAERVVGPDRYDFGASYFTARSPELVQQVAQWEHEGVCARWDGRIGATGGVGQPVTATTPADRFVGTPRMSALADHLAQRLVIETSHRVDAVERSGAQLVLRGAIDGDGRTLAPARGGERGADVFGSFDAVAVCVPAPQVSPLLDGVAAELAEVARSVVMEPCLVVGFATDDDRVKALAYDGVFIGRDDSAFLSWVARESSKPGRAPGERWVLHAGPSASRTYASEDPERITARLIEAFREVFGLAPFAVTSTACKRWVFARGGAELAPLPFDRALAIGVAGDWSHGGRIEGAFLAGRALAERVSGAVTDERA